VYFISETDGDVYVRNISGTISQRIFELHSTNENDRLLVKTSSTHSNSWNLFARLETDDDRNPKLVKVKEGFATTAVLDCRASEEPHRDEGTWFNFGRVAQLGDAEKSNWTFDSGFWPIEGLRGTNGFTHDHVFFSYETPFGQWAVRNATELPNETVIFQLGENQICILDPTSKKVALFAHGRGPVAAIDGTIGD
jgi:hypothetical protein